MSIWQRLGIPVGEIRRLLGEVMASPRFNGPKIATYLIGGGLLESASILMLLPLLQSVQGGSLNWNVRVPEALQGFGLPAALSVPLVAILVALVVLVTLQALVVWMKTRYLQDLIMAMVNDFRLELFDRITKANWEFVAQHRKSDMLQLMTGHAGYLSSTLNGMMTIFQNVVLTTIFVGISLAISVEVTLVSIVVGGLVVLVLYPVRQQTLRFSNSAFKNTELQLQTLSDFFDGLKVAKSFGAEGRFHERLDASFRTQETLFSEHLTLSLTVKAAIQIVGALAAAIVAYVSLGVLAIPLEAMLVMLVIYLRITPRIMNFNDQLQTILRGIPAYVAIRTMREDSARFAEQVSEGRVGDAPLASGIRFEGVTFKFAAAVDQAALSAVDFEVPAGRTTAIVGASGSGKTTSADLLMGLLAPTSGRIVIDGEPLEEIGRRSWRASVAYVPQDVFLLHDTIAANMRLGRPEATDEELWAALEAAGAMPFMSSLPLGLDTELGDRGMRLSGGERQRIALARALVVKPKVLILDEATSALDLETQQVVADAIERLRGSLTVVTIAHRASMIAIADWVVVMDKGRVVETGPYRELIAREASALRALLGNGAEEPGVLAARARADGEARQPAD
jgi:ATP-binding cassette subfamily C protein